MCFGSPDLNNTPTFRGMQPAGSADFFAFSPTETRSTTKARLSRGIRGKFQRVGNTIKQRGETLFRRTGQLPPSTQSSEYLLLGPQQDDSPQGAQLMYNHWSPMPRGRGQDSIIDAVEAAIDGMSSSASPRPNSYLPQEPALPPLCIPTNDTGRRYPANPDDVGLLTPINEAFDDPAELPSTPDITQVARYAEAEERYNSMYATLGGTPRDEDGLSAANCASRHASRIVPAVGDRRPPYPLTPPPSPPANTSCFPRANIGRSESRKRAATIGDAPPSKRRRDGKVFTSADKVGLELHLDAMETSNKISPLSKVVIAELDGDHFNNDKAMKRRSRSLSEIGFVCDLKVSERKNGFTQTDSPLGLKAGPSPTRKTFMMLQEQTTPNAGEGLFDGKPAWKIYTPSGPTDSTYKAYVPGEIVRCEEVIPSEEKVKAQKQTNRISNGFMLEQAPFMDMVAAVAGDKLMLTMDFEYDDTEPRSPVSPLEPPAAFREYKLDIAAAGVDELHGRAGGHATYTKPTSSAPKVSFDEGATAEYKTLRRVRAAKVELRYLARPIPQGESKPLLTTTGCLFDAPIPTNLPTALPSRLLSPKHKEDESSWDWPRFTDREHADPAVEHSRRFREKKVWAKKNSGDLIDFWKEEPVTEKKGKEREEVKKPRPLSARFSATTSKAFNDLLDLWEKR